MLEERELVAVFVALAVCGFFLMNRGKLAEVPHSRLLIVSIGLLTASLVCSVIEVFVWEDTANLIQHTLAPASSVVLAIWSWLTFVRREGSST